MSEKRRHISFAVLLSIGIRLSAGNGGERDGPAALPAATGLVLTLPALDGRRKAAVPAGKPRLECLTRRPGADIRRRACIGASR